MKKYLCYVFGFVAVGLVCLFSFVVNVEAHEIEGVPLEKSISEYDSSTGRHKVINILDYTLYEGTCPTGDHCDGTHYIDTSVVESSVDSSPLTSVYIGPMGPTDYYRRGFSFEVVGKKFVSNDFAHIKTVRETHKIGTKTYYYKHYFEGRVYRPVARRWCYDKWTDHRNSLQQWFPSLPETEITVQWPWMNPLNMYFLYVNSFNVNDHFFS